LLSVVRSSFTLLTALSLSWIIVCPPVDRSSRSGEPLFRCS
jgi:hypothetical protein